MSTPPILLLGDSRNTKSVATRALVSAGYSVDHRPLDASSLQHDVSRYEMFIVDGDGGGDRLVPVLDAVSKIAEPDRILVLAHEGDDCTTDYVLRGASNNMVSRPVCSLSNDRIDESELIATCRKMLGHDRFGLHSYVGRNDIKLYDGRLRHSRDRAELLDAMDVLLGDLCCNNTLSAMILTTADELMMNAVFNAPHDGGEPRYRGVERSESFDLADDEVVDVGYGCDGRYFYLSVTDHFGALEKDLVLRYIGAGLQQKRAAMRQQPHGAGLGLFIVFSSINKLVFNVEVGKRCEIIAAFDIRSGVRGLREGGRALNFFVYR